MFPLPGLHGGTAIASTNATVALAVQNAGQRKQRDRTRIKHHDGGAVSWTPANRRDAVDLRDSRIGRVWRIDMVPYPWASGLHPEWTLS